MTKNILAIAIAAAVAAPSAFAAATVYGLAHMAVTQQSDVANGGASASQMNVSSNSSRLGIKGDEDLGGGLKAVYQMEFGVSMDGEGATTNGIGSMRNTFAGIGGGFGTVLVGRHDSPIKLVGRSYDLFGDQMGNNRNMLGAGGALGNAVSHAVDGRHSNVIAYATPTFGGFSALIAYVPGADAASAGNEPFSNTANKQNAWSAMAGYKAGAFGASLGYIAADNYGGATVNANATRAGAEYTFGAAKVVALYQTVSVDGFKSMNAYGAGASYKVTAAGTVKGQYYTAENNNGAKNGAGMLTVGYDHAMSKNTTAYAAYAMVDNNAAGTFTTAMGNSGVGDGVTAIAGKDNSAFSVGLIHKF